MCQFAKKMFGSSLPPFVYLEGPCLFMLFVLFIVYSDAQRGVLTILVTVRVSYKSKELYFVREHLGYPPPPPPPSFW